MKTLLAGAGRAPLRALVALALLPALPAAAVTVTVDANANLHPIDPRVYGLAYADGAQLTDLNCPLNRQGGNPTSRYNWNVNSYNRASDFFFESIVDGGSATPGKSADDFVQLSKNA